MSSGRTSWWAKDAAWYRRERVVVLINEFGPAGAVVIDWLCCEASSQDGYLEGSVKAGNHAVSRATKVSAKRVGAIVQRAAELELLEDLEVGPVVFTCRVSGWRADRDRALAGIRKERFEANKKRSRTEMNDLNGNKRSEPPTAQHSTAQQGGWCSTVSRAGPSTHTGDQT